MHFFLGDSATRPTPNSMAVDVPRYLVPFHPKRIPHHFCDVLIIGGGIAGLRAAMQIDPRLSILVITKDTMEQSNSAYAQGGIASVIDPDDNFASHVEDTLIAGANLCDREVVEMVVSEAPQHIRQLIEWGTNFDREQGELQLGREGGHSHRRIVHALGDATGFEIMRAIIQRVRDQQDAQVWTNTFTIDLLTHEGRCRGALVWHAQHGRTFIWAKETILCTGGAGQIFRETTNPEVATGDGHALAYRAGAELRDMEFMQFHPTVLYIAGGSRSLITEAMRGEGARLIDATGRRFMPDYDERAELAPRDVVSQAIVEQMEKTRQPSVFLDMSHLDADRVRKRFPGITQDMRRVRDRHRDRSDSGAARCALHDRRRDGRSPRSHDGARPVGGGRSYEQRAARRESTGVEQFAGRARVRCACGSRRDGERACETGFV